MTIFKNDYRPEIEKSIKDFFKKEKTQKPINIWQRITLTKLEKLVLKGKLIRGYLVILGAAIYSKKVSKDVFKLAAAIEIFHTAFLIHDDVMDNEKMRRGGDSVHEQFKNLALKENLNEVEAFGKSMAINAGDMAIFLGLKSFNLLDVDSKTKTEMINLITQEMINLGAAQMQDIYLGSSQNKVTEEEILDLYKYKTARYSFVLPLRLGMLLSGYSDKKVEKLGELLGLIYQIKDDEIGLFSNSKISGKSKGLDLKQKKKTFFYKYLIDNLDSSDKAMLDSISENLNQDLLNDLIQKSNSRNLVNKKIQLIADEYKQLLIQSDLPRDTKQIFNNLFKFNLNRKK